MKRLLDEHEPSDAPTVELISALRDRKLDPHLEGRILSRIKAGRRRTSARLRPLGAFAALLLLCLVSAASAMIWKRVMRPTAPPSNPNPSPSRSPSPIPTSGDPITSVPPPVPSLAPPPAPSPSPSRRKSPAVAAAPAATPPEATAATPAAVAPQTASAAESLLLLEAYRALRQQRDPASAQRKVDDYLMLFPRGVLTEEALELALEATATNPPDAARYAQLYLQRFPAGKAAARARALLKLD